MQEDLSFYRKFKKNLELIIDLKKISITQSLLFMIILVWNSKNNIMCNRAGRFKFLPEIQIILFFLIFLELIIDFFIKISIS